MLNALAMPVDVLLLSMVTLSVLQILTTHMQLFQVVLQPNLRMLYLMYLRTVTHTLLTLQSSFNDLLIIRLTVTTKLNNKIYK